jgi:glutamine amidotransferase
MIGILDYGMGNLLSVYNAFDYFGVDVVFCKTPADLETVERIVIPGVGAFKDCVNKLKAENFIGTLNEQVLEKKKPTLGICLGMQIMAKKSFEGGENEGLGWFDAEVIKLHPKTDNFKIPNIGWDEIQYCNGFPLFKGISQNSDFYFVHSYYMKCESKSDVVAHYNHSFDVTAAISKANIFATQFHPEKSQDNGLKVIENFINWVP